VREAGQFIEQHLLFAIPLPYSVLELKIMDLVPRKDVPILLIDEGDQVAERAATRLEELGFSDVLVLQGGMPAWVMTGFPVYKGVNVPSKVMGELAETVWHPDMITPEALKTKLDSGVPLRFYDVRPQAEYAKMRVPKAACMPNGELAHRIAAVEGKDKNRPIVLTCAGRTRGIIGAIGLKLSGHPGPVAALENGTQGWALSGSKLERGNKAEPLPPLQTTDQQISSQRGAEMCARFNIERISPGGAEERLHAQDRTTYFFDLRTQDEADAEPLAGARVVPGVQLVQATDQYVGVRHARLILACDTGLRSAIAAFWLHQLGFQVFVLALNDWSEWQTVSDSDSAISLPDMVSLPASEITPADILIDVRPSQDYQNSHIEGASWSIRPMIGDLSARHSGMRMLFIDAGDGRAQLCAIDAIKAGHKDVAIVEGGHDTLSQQGWHLVSTPDTPSDKDAIDFPFFVHDRHDGNLESARRYLAWETGLVAQLDAVERQEFKLFLP
ncbi:MAG: rhodanese-like domain-containing protein, partial [Hyphomicrobiales bacterium]